MNPRIGTRELFPWSKAAAGEAGRPLPSRAETENNGAIPLLPHTSLWHDV
jgi:hypothetical protein